MSDQGKWITKDAAKKVIRKYVIWHKAIKAIDALEPVAEVQDAVSRKAVLKRLIAFRQALKRTAPTEELIGAEITELRRQVREDLPPVLPAESRRSEAEVRVAIEKLTIYHHYTSVSFVALGDIEEAITKLFAPSGSNQDKGKEGNK
ncbi:MAG: hypothetical protein IMF11_20245 [Proteobacteria bacterium]|nr:hypothetical protein [Pseudomonadota bacterium]